ncbi:MAG: glutathione S-transferase family protein [Novosphingobium sp.]
MAIDPIAPTAITGFANVPPFARGKVRDLRVRWALEEIGRPYRTELFDAFTPRPREYLARQPFGQVPAFADGEVRLFESGAILLYLGEQDERLLPRGGQARWNAIAWTIAALNSVEPMVMQLVFVEVFHADKPWSKQARPEIVALLTQRLQRVADALGDEEWIAVGFSVADILLVTVLRNLPGDGVLAGFPTLVAYVARGEGRPAFARALADQLSQFEPAQGEQ